MMINIICNISYFAYCLNEKMINLRNKSVIRFLGTSNEFVIQQEKKEEKKKKFSTQLVAQVS